jgi:hypothetical protein
MDLAAPSDRSNTRSAFLHGQQQQVLGLQKYKYEYDHMSSTGDWSQAGTRRDWSRAIEDVVGLLQEATPPAWQATQSAQGGHTPGMASNTQSYHYYDEDV